MHYFQCNRIKFNLSFINYWISWHSNQIQQRARIGKIIARWHLAIARTSLLILSLGKNFFLNLSGVRIFSPTYNGVRFFSTLYVMSDVFFFGTGYFFRGIYLHAFFLSKSVCRTFFLRSPITPSKVKWSAPKIHQTFGHWQILICQSFPKAFETIWDKTL